MSELMTINKTNIYPLSKVSLHTHVYDLCNKIKSLRYLLTITLRDLRHGTAGIGGMCIHYRLFTYCNKTIMRTNRKMYCQTVELNQTMFINYH